MHTVISNNKRKARRNGMEQYHPDFLTLKTLLEKHDWYYMYSDDHRAYTKGREEYDEIRRQMDICCGLGLGQQANELYEQYQK